MVRAAVMVLIEAIIKPFKLDDVKEALEELGVGGITVTEALQTATQTRGRTFGATPTTAGMVPKIKIQVAAPSELAERIIESICLHGATGKSEDGRLTVEPIDRVVRIRTGEMDSDAIS
jgi:nitrogen regulatory protein PII